MKRLVISFSGGRTSAEMARLLTMFPKAGQTIVTIFVNTGEEDERTLEFVDRCDKEWKLNVVWLESKVNPQHGKGTEHQIVTYTTATRGPSLFEAMIDKYGIPNKNYPHCTRELKLAPIKSYLSSIQWKTGSYDTAIGIRADEIDRISAKAKEQRLLYPLVKMGVRKPDVMAFWDAQPFDLLLPEHRGNCVWCWKKSLRKHLTLARETPEIFNFANRMEIFKSEIGGHSGKGNRVFFRDRLTADRIVKMAQQPFELFADQRYLDQENSCSESCEVHSDEDEKFKYPWENA